MMLPGQVLIGTYRDHNEAALARFRLENEGIDVYVPFEHVAALRIPLVSGPVRLYVREEDAHEAKQLLESGVIAEDVFMAPLSTEVDEDDDQYRCQHCNSSNVRLLPAPLIPTFLSMVVPGYSLEKIPSRWHCLNCDRLSEE